MATRTGPWSWLSNPDNQKTLAFIGGGIAAVAAAGWQLYVHFADTRAPAQPAPTAATPGGVTVGGNVSGSPIIAGGNVTIGGQPVDPEQARKLIESQGKAVDAITSRMTGISNAIETGDASKLSNPPAPASKGP
ncbi:MAG TPA: hypothetical protein VFC14_26250 [Burkholderiales bacterium]|jgi:hypothetical protein|nr:hypothetical protein [Burkholderiales bacterium]